MTATKKLYRVIRTQLYNGGVGDQREQGQILLYCGYDRDEARRIYHSATVEDRKSRGPGSYYDASVCQSLVTDED